MTTSSLQYQKIKTFILAGIDGGDWAEGAKIPSENELASKFSLSRMTVNRAIKELEADGVVNRVQGKGTFVSPPRPLSSVLKIQGIDDEIRARGNQYSCRVVGLRAVKANSELSYQLEIPAGAEIFHSSIVHCENEIPMQLERRWVKPSIWKRFLQQDFTKQTPHAYMMEQVPFSKGEHTIQAQIADARVRRTLKMDEDEACLTIHRRTWVRDSVASFVKLIHPGNRFQLKTQLTKQ
jgi:GntR family histidine utilization transcriptional repressor